MVTENRDVVGAPGRFAGETHTPWVTHPHRHPSGEFARDARTLEPIVGSELLEDLRYLGVTPGDRLVVHSSMRAVGFVVGGAQTVVRALLDAVGPRGTVVVPTHSGLWSEPSHWSIPMPEAWWDKIRAGTPGYHPRTTPTTAMGAIPECMRRWPGFRRSWHPRVSFGAVGHDADELLADHAFTAGFGERSPLGRLYERGAKIVLLGVGHTSSSALHFAESRAVWPGKRWIDQGAAIAEPDDPAGAAGKWVRWREIDHDASDFGEIGKVIAAAGIEQVGSVGNAPARLMPLAAAVDIAVEWITANRVWEVKQPPSPLPEFYR